MHAGVHYKTHGIVLVPLPCPALLFQAECLFLFEQAGVQKKLKEAGLWYATAPEEELMEVMRREPGLLRDWDDKYGDRMQKIVFIGQHLDKEQLVRDLDACLE